MSVTLGGDVYPAEPGVLVNLDVDWVVRSNFEVDLCPLTLPFDELDGRSIESAA